MSKYYNDLIADAQARVATLTAIIAREEASPSHEPRAWILADALGRGIKIEFVHEEGTTFRARGAGFENAENATRFTEEEAYALMKAMNYNAFHWLDAVRDNLEQTEYSIELFQKREAMYV